MVSDTRLPGSRRPLLVGAFLLAACSPPPPAPPPPAPLTNAPVVPGTTEASLRVRARMEGPAPRFAPMVLSKDAFCESAHKGGILEPETVVAREGRLANVMAWVSRGLPTESAPQPHSSIPVEMRGCQFRPHVFTSRTEQPIQIKNTDPVTHCAHADSRTASPFNITIRGGTFSTVAFDKSEVAVRIKCDCYGWMETWVGIFDHPYHGVTGEDGSLTLKVPPGSYEVSAWHEYRKFAKQAPRPVTVAAGEAKEVEFVFRVP